MTRTMSAIVTFAACCALANCGDVTSDLITAEEHVDGGGGTAGSDSSGGTAGSSDAGTLPEASPPPPVCSTNTQCSDSLPLCNVATGSCVECVLPTDCDEDPERTLCNTSGKCVECTEIGHCSEGESCIPRYGLCATMCTGPADCFDEMCDLASGFCVECVENTDCRDPEEPFCRDLECSAEP